MGLDMTLYAKRYFSSFDPADVEKSSKLAKLFPEVAELPVKEVSIEVGYWRKANAVHCWFVDNVQGGVDNCAGYYVARPQLEELRNLCLSIISDHSLAHELKPVSGFFFGSTSIDENYFHHLANTVKIINRALALPSDWEFEYSSSW